MQRELWGPSKGSTWKPRCLVQVSELIACNFWAQQLCCGQRLNPVMRTSTVPFPLPVPRFVMLSSAFFCKFTFQNLVQSLRQQGISCKGCLLASHAGTSPLKKGPAEQSPVLWQKSNLQVQPSWKQMLDRCSRR